MISYRSGLPRLERGDGGQADFVVTAPVQLGRFPASYSARLIDPGAYPDGTVLCLTNYQISRQTERSIDR